MVTKSTVNSNIIIYNKLPNYYVGSDINGNFSSLGIVKPVC